LNVVNASHPIEVLTKGPNPELGKDDENTVTNGCSSCGRGSAQEKNKKCAKWQPSPHVPNHQPEVSYSNPQKDADFC
jgi:formate dehydrogenase assembly factor FdhD